MKREFQVKIGLPFCTENPIRALIGGESPNASEEQAAREQAHVGGLWLPGDPAVCYHPRRFRLHPKNFG
jgi:hypothetical protein